MIKLLLHSWLFSSPSLADGHSRNVLPLTRYGQLVKEKVSGIENEVSETLKLLRRRKNARTKENKTTDRGVQALIIGLALVLFLLVGCSGVKHIIQIEEPTDHTSGDDGGKLKYKIIWGDINQKE